MRMIFGLMSLLIVLAVVGTLGKKQLQGLGQMGTTTARTPSDPDAKAVTDAVMGRARDGGPTAAVPGGVPGATAAAVEGSVPMQARAIQNNVRDAANAALQKGADRNNGSQP